MSGPPSSKGMALSTGRVSLLSRKGPLVVALVSALVPGLACRKDKCTTCPPPTPAVVTVDVSGPSSSLMAGSTMQLTARANDADGDMIAGKTFSWESDNETVATVSTGLVTAKATGTAVIKAKVDGKEGSKTLTITAPPTVATVTVSGSVTSLEVGATTQLSATATDANGVTIAGKVFSW